MRMRIPRAHATCMCAHARARARVQCGGVRVLAQGDNRSQGGAHVEEGAAALRRRVEHLLQRREDLGRCAVLEVAEHRGDERDVPRLHLANDLHALKTCVSERGSCIAARGRGGLRGQ